MIQVGEYVRIKQGYVGRVENINDFRPPESEIALDIGREDFVFVSKEDIKKHSLNIIDLIECGDYVNGEKVWEIIKYNGKNSDLLWYDEYEGTAYSVGEIKSIVTKEMMKSVEYRVV